MLKIAFFCIPAYGHTNPTLEVVRTLVGMGHQVHYYSYEPFRSKIENAGAVFIPCDAYDAQVNLNPGDAARVGRDMAFSIKLLADTTLSLDEMVCDALKGFAPDCVIADSMAVWGKFAALKLGIPFINSTTTFAFNRHSAKVMKGDIHQLLDMLRALPSMRRDVKRLRARGYPVKNFLSLIQNDNDTRTIVYTSTLFQPCAETFSDRYAFVGPSLAPATHVPLPRGERKLVYVSLGTVNTNMPDFYKNCITALKDGDWDVIMSVGDEADMRDLGEIPAQFTVAPHVHQMDVLRRADVFITHCGMNSVSEGLYCNVPLALFPQTTEQHGVSLRVHELGAGVYVAQNTPPAIRAAVDTLVGDPSYKQNAQKIAESFRQAGGAQAAAEFIVRTCHADAQ